MDCEEGFGAVNEGYKIWKKHAPFLYSQLQTYELSSCSQTVEWFSEIYLENDWKMASLLIGTNSLTQNALQLLTVALPTDDALTDYSTYRQERPESSPSAAGFVGTMGQQNVTVRVSVPQSSQVMRARINRFDQNTLAVKTGGANPEFIIYDLRNKEEDLENNSARLTGHTEEGFGLAWSPHDAAHLLSSAYDARILLYSMQHLESPERTWECSEGVEDVKWSALNPALIASAHSDQKVSLWDVRGNDQKPCMSRKAHNGQVYSVDFNKKSQFLLLSGGEDGDVNMWDVRNMSKKLHTFVGHNDAVNAVAWSPHSAVRFATASSDRRTLVWDVERLSENTSDRQGNEILFIHGGHRSKVTDLSWSGERDVIGSCQQNNTLQVWKMTDSLLSSL